MMRIAVVALIAGCSSPSSPPPLKPGSAIAIVIDAGLDAAVIDAAPVRVPGDPTEPVAPQAECAFDRSVFCITGTPTRVALQPSPFEWCPRTQPARLQSFYKLDAQFSAVETRKARATQAAACCYVEFSTMACD